MCVCQVVCKYLEDPVLFDREEVGLVKFDIRYMVLLRSVQPLRLYAYDVFWLRFANRSHTHTPGVVLHLSYFTLCSITSGGAGEFLVLIGQKLVYSSSDCGSNDGFILMLSLCDIIFLIYFLTAYT